MPQASLLVLRTQSSKSDKRCQGADNDTKTRLYRSVIFLIRWNKLPKAKEALGRECNLHISRNPASLGNHERLDWAESWFCHWCQEGSSHGWKEKLWLNGRKKRRAPQEKGCEFRAGSRPPGKEEARPLKPSSHAEDQRRTECGCLRASHRNSAQKKDQVPKWTGVNPTMGP